MSAFGADILRQPVNVGPLFSSRIECPQARSQLFSRLTSACLRDGKEYVVNGRYGTDRYETQHHDSDNSNEPRSFNLLLLHRTLPWIGSRLTEGLLMTVR